MNSVCRAFKLHPIVKARQSTFVISGAKIGNNYICKKKFLKSYFKKHINLNHDIIYITYTDLSKPITEKLSQPTRTMIKTSEDARQIIGGNLYL